MTGPNKHMQESESKCDSKQCLLNSSRNNSLCPGWYQDGSSNSIDVQGEISRHWSWKEEALSPSKVNFWSKSTPIPLHKPFQVWLQTSILKKTSFPTVGTHGVHLALSILLIFIIDAGPVVCFSCVAFFSKTHHTPHGTIPSYTHCKKVMFNLVSIFIMMQWKEHQAEVKEAQEASGSTLDLEPHVEATVAAAACEDGLWICNYE